jgi:DNA polymerase elongation subunit (family B)
MRFIAKMHLNQLYGYLGRRKTLIQTKNVLTKDLIEYYGNYTIFSEIKINEEITTILMGGNLDYDLINEIKNDTGLDLIYNFRKIKSNVGIAAAVTSYARIEMIKLKMLLNKLGIKLFYTDTDSIFIDKELPRELIGRELGQLKDELNGGFIKKAYFFGIKKYGFIDNNDQIHSVFSGIERNSLSWDEIELISKGITIMKSSPPRFFKNISDLNIKIKHDLKTAVEFNPRKKLSRNKYLPIYINIKILITIDYFIRLLKTKLLI